nr:putative ribonuclease H-like domain-containing protein [Tanacetum cinerariifolium]
MRPFGCHVTILNTLDSLGIFDGKVDEGFLVGYSVSSKAFRVFNSRTRIIQETLHVTFYENKPNVTSSSPTWLFDIDTLTKTMNYQPVPAGNQSNPSACVQENLDAEKAGEEIRQQYELFPVWSSGFTTPQNTNEDVAFDEKAPEFDAKKPESKVDVSPSSSTQSKKHDDKTKREAKGKSHVESFTGYRNLSAEFEDFSDNSINEVNAAGTLVLNVGQISPNSTNTFSAAGPSNAAASPTHGKSSCINASQLLDDPDMPKLEDITYSDDEDDVGAEADFNNLETSIKVSPILTTRVHKDHPITQIIGDLSSATQTRSMERVAKDQGGLSQMFNDDFHTCMFACFLSQEEPKRVHQALKDPSWIKAMQKELLQFKMQKVWVLVNFPYGKRAICTKWVFKNKKDERGIVVTNKASLVAQEHTQEEGIDYEKIFAPVARIEAIRLFLAYASFMGFMVYQMDVKSAFLYETIEEEVYVCQPLGFKDPDYPDKVYKVAKALYGLHQALRAYGKSASTPIDNKKPLLKDPDAQVDKKKVVVTEATIRDALHLDDAEGVECLPNEEIFAELARIGYEKPSTKLTFYKAFFSSQWKFLIHTILECMSAKRTSSNEFSSSMASAVICLSSGKGFSGVETPLFEGMVVAQEVDEGVADEVHDEGVPAADVATKGVDVVPTVEEEPSIPSPTPPTPPPQPSHDIPSTSQGRMITDMDEDADVVLEEAKDVDADLKADQDADEEESEPTELQEVVDIVTTAKIITEVVTAASTTITAADVPVPAATTVAAPKLTAAPSRRTKGVVIKDSEEFTTTTSTIIHSEANSKDKGKGILVEEPKPLKKQAQIKQDEKYARELVAKLNRTIDWDEVIDHVNKKAKEDKSVKRYQVMKRKPQTEAQARKNMMVYLKYVSGFKMDYFKDMTYDDIRQVFQKHFNSNVAFLQKTKEQIDEEESRALKRINKTSVENATKRQKLVEEVEELKRHLQIVPNEDDDVYTKATPLARKVPVIDYEIHNQNNKPYYKIIRADGTHQLFLSFLSMLRNFDREDLEALWSLVKERFATAKPKKFSDDFLLITLGAMFKKPDIHAQIWKNQRSVHGQAKVKKRKYPLTRFTLDQMLHNVRLEVEEESESQNSVHYVEPNLSSRPTIVEVPKELSKVSMVNSSFKKLKFQLASFDVTYKQLYDSIKSSLVRSKEQYDDLIKQVNIKSAENSDLNASLQEKDLVIIALKDTLSKLKGKAVVDEAVTLHPIDP